MGLWVRPLHCKMSAYSSRFSRGLHSVTLRDELATVLDRYGKLKSALATDPSHH